MNNNKRVIYAIFIVLVIMCGIIYTYFNFNDNNSKLSIDVGNNDENGINISGKLEVEGNENNEENNEDITVYICGAVVNEGVYTLVNGARVYEAIELAGGFTSDAVKEAVNLARQLADEEQIIVPTEEDIISGKYNYENNDNNKLININYASKELLMTLPGIGEAKADSIIKYRENNGLFNNIEDIMNVNGIKDALYNNIKDLITI